MTYEFDLELGGRQGTITELFLRREARRSDIGSAALEFVERHLLRHHSAAQHQHEPRHYFDASSDSNTSPMPVVCV